MSLFLIASLTVPKGVFRTITNKEVPSGIFPTGVVQNYFMTFREKERNFHFTSLNLRGKNKLIVQKL
eukprot:UN00208